MSVTGAVVVATSAMFAGLMSVLLVNVGHRVEMLLRLRASASGVSDRKEEGSERDCPLLPSVTVQLPLYNEGAVMERLLHAVAALDYPRELLEVQVLDDSTDGTAERSAALVEELRAAGVNIVHRHRVERTGYKAGALAAGLREARGELVAIFDADFVPPRDWLRRVVPVFGDGKVGMVQGRWGHLNAAENFLTRLQEVLIDCHFLIEQPGRARCGLMFNFNGTVGVWRRQCLHDAGGWEADTLTEDLDISYRAQLAGWEFRYVEAAVAPGELPATMLAYKSQQHRWAKGSMQTARKLMGRVLRAPRSFGAKVEAVLHLAGYALNAAVAALAGVNLAAYALVVAGGLALPAWLPPVFWGMMAACLGFMAVGLWRAGKRDVGSYALLLPVAACSIGLSLHHAWAWLSGAWEKAGEFVRTPKGGTASGGGGSAAARRARWINIAEIAFAAAYLVALMDAVMRGEWSWVATHALHAAGLSYVAWETHRELVGRGRRVHSGLNAIAGSEVRRGGSNDPTVLSPVPCFERAHASEGASR